MDDQVIVIPPDLLAFASSSEQEQYKQYLISEALERDEWETLLPAIAPEYANVPFADHHKLFWNWVWGIDAGTRPNSFVGIWPRGGAKSTSVEMAVATMGARGKRRYCLYVSETQDQADDHVANIANLLESGEFDYAYPAMGERMHGKHGNVKGWRRDRIRTSSGFTVDAIGLDTAARGIKLEDMRPDLIVLDDIDGEHDSETVTTKKIKTITRSLIPAGARNVAIIAIQNMVHDDSIFAQLADNRADFLRGRQVSGPIPAIWNPTIEEQNGRWVIVDGTPSWPEGQSIAVCEAMMNDMGYTAFLAECQHQAVTLSGGMFDHLDWSGIQVTEAELPPLVRVIVWLDPAVTSTDNSDCQGIICDGLGNDGLIYRLWAWEGRPSPH